MMLTLRGTYVPQESLRRNPDAWTQGLNRYILRLMNASHLTPEAANLDPLRLNDVILSNDMKSYRMAIYGLSTSERSIDLEIGIKGTDIHAVADFKIGDLIVRGHYTYWAGGLFPLHGRFGVGFDSIGCFTRIDTDHGALRVTNFTVTYLENLRITEFTGISVFLNWIAKFVVNKGLQMKSQEFKKIAAIVAIEQFDEHLEHINTTALIG